MWGEGPIDRNLPSSYSYSMTSNGPYGPDPSSGYPQPGPGGPGYSQPTQSTQPAHGGWEPPVQPGHHEPPTQAVPSYAPPSTADYHPAPFSQTGNVGGGPPGRGGGQRALLAGVLGGLATLAAIVGGFLILSSDDDAPEPDPQALVDPDPTETSDPANTEGTTESTVPDRIGTAVTGLELLPGDCINYDPASTSIETFDVVTCGTPHLAEIAAQLPHPDAGGPYPGAAELHSWASGPCNDASSEYLGTDLLATTFTSSTLVPEADEWVEGLTSVNCLILVADGDRIIESVAGRGSSYRRETETAINRLRAGDCFLPKPPQTAFDLGADDIVALAPCNEAHDGLFFGRGEATGTTYPDVDELDTQGIEICDAAFSQFFAVASDGLNYRYWTPSQTQWEAGERTVECAVLDENGLPTSLDYSTYQVMFLLPIGQCFEFGPEENVEFLRLDDQVRPVDCAQPHNGEVFGLGELPATSEPFPGDEVVDQQVQDLCIDLFASYVGISPFDSVSGDFRYWFPSEAGWEAGDQRWACALVNDEPATGSIAGTNA